MATPLSPFPGERTRSCTWGSLAWPYFLLAGPVVEWDSPQDGGATHFILLPPNAWVSFSSFPATPEGTALLLAFSSPLPSFPP